MQNKITKVPINIVDLDSSGFHITVFAKASRFKLNLLIDTGASKSIFDINHKAFASFDLVQLDDDIKSSGINAEISGINAAIIPNFKIGDMRVTDMPALFMPFEHINNVYIELEKKPIAGIIGGDFLLKYDAIIDYESKELILKIK
ncbi:MAG: hypothetical protein GX879_05085 [Bacteroidales bacterium]|nr:hypothetical protein [Bacteroidales bacterium]